MRLVCPNLLKTRRPPRVIGAMTLLVYSLTYGAQFAGLVAAAPASKLANFQRSVSQRLVSQQLIFVDPNVKDYATLLKGLPPSQVIVLDPNRDGVEQMTAAIAQRQNLTGIHILSHGQPESVMLGRTQLNRVTLDRYAAQLQQWSRSLANNADILFYGCDLVGNAAGETLIQTLSQLTGADIAASTNRTGSAKLGGDWVLEQQTGSIETPLAFTPEARNAYPGVLPPPCITNPLYNTTGTTVGIVNLNTGALTSVGTLAFPTFASTRQEGTGLLYYIESVAGNPRVGTWNPQTGVNTTIGNTGTAGVFIQKLAQQAGTGALYAADGATNILYTINPLTGAATGNITIALPFPPGGGGGDMAFDPLDPNRLLISVRNVNRVQLYAVTVPATPPTAATILTPTLIGDLVTVPPGPDPGNPNIANTGALAFGQDGDIYLVVRADNPLGNPISGNPDGILYRVNRNTFAVTEVGPTPFSSDFATLPVPTPQVNLIPTKSRTSTLVPGSPITYTINVTNPPATCDVTGISVVDTVPPFVTNTTWTSTVNGVGSVTPATGAGNALNLSVNLNTGSTATITIQGTIATNGAAIAPNIVTVQNPPGINPEPPISVSDDPAPRLRLVKRITNITRRGTTIPGLDFTRFVDDPSDINDTVPGWTQLSPVGLLRVAAVPQVRTGDEIEYTVYFLNDGTSDLADTGLCDPIPTSTTFVPNSLQIRRNAGAPAPGGQFFSPLAPLPVNNPCPSSANPNGSAIFTLGTLPSSTGNNFGFVRFRVRIN
jgi:uncharacterized repeat protein (TIGR01451 family)